MGYGWEPISILTKPKMTIIASVLLLLPQVVYADAFEVTFVHGSNHVSHLSC